MTNVTAAGVRGAAAPAVQTTATGDVGGKAGDAISFNPFICAHCSEPSAIGNTIMDFIQDFIQAFRKPTCKNGHHTFHHNCYKIATRKNNSCKLCPLNELPFLNSDTTYEQNSFENVTINPSTMPDDLFECLKKKGLHFVHINARSLPPKLSEIMLLVEKYKIAVLTISESWLDQSHTDNSVSIDGYNVIRRDRDTHAEGVCMYVREDLRFNLRPDLKSQNLEDL